MKTLIGMDKMTGREIGMLEKRRQNGWSRFVVRVVKGERDWLLVEREEREEREEWSSWDSEEEEERRPIDFSLFLPKGNENHIREVDSRSHLHLNFHFNSRGLSSHIGYSYIGIDSNKICKFQFNNYIFIVFLFCKKLGS